MLKTGILNPQLNSLLSRVRHTNLLVIADRGFPFWMMIETVDISLVDDVPTVLQVLTAIRSNFVIGKAWMAKEFLQNNNAKTKKAFASAYWPRSTSSRNPQLPPETLAVPSFRSQLSSMAQTAASPSPAIRAKKQATYSE